MYKREVFTSALNVVVSHKVYFCTSVIYRERNLSKVSYSVFIDENQFRKHWPMYLPLYKGPSVYLYFQISDRCLEKMLKVQNWHYN